MGISEAVMTHMAHGASIIASCYAGDRMWRCVYPTSDYIQTTEEAHGWDRGRPCRVLPQSTRRLPTALLEGARWGVSEVESKSSAARTRSLRWMELLWEGANTVALEEDRKEEVLAVFRELARDSKGVEVREYVPWEPRWR